MRAPHAASRPVFRFAPSPNGALHLGHALSALTGFDMASRLAGRFLVRIEDIDTTRARPEFVAGIFEDLRWLGVTWEEPVLIQSQHFADYATAAGKLLDMRLLYPCFATRNEIAARATGATDPDGAPLYPGIWRGRPAADIAAAKARAAPFALRLDMEKATQICRAKLRGRPLEFREMDSAGAIRMIEARPERWGDAVLVRKEFPASYHLAVVADDARQGVTHVTRGADLFGATDLHRLIQVLLDLPEPVYSHHALIKGEDGQKLSKSRADTSLASLRASGLTPAQIRRMIGLG